METRVVILLYGCYDTRFVITNAPKEIIYEAIGYSEHVEESFIMSRACKYSAIRTYVNAKGYVFERIAGTNEKYNYL